MTRGRTTASNKKHKQRENCHFYSNLNAKFSYGEPNPELIIILFDILSFPPSRQAAGSETS